VKIVSWNVNSIRARLDRALAWLDRHQPDVLCLQELKVEDKDLPREAFDKAGYHTAAVCQKTYNGVAILARRPRSLSDVRCGLDDGIDDSQARLVAATCEGIRILSVYVPNGQAVGSDKFAYKVEWMARLRRYLDTHLKPSDPVAMGGDFNVAPEARDVHSPAAWQGETLFHVDARAALERVRGFGLVDTFRIHHQEAGRYSWWDYRMLGFPRNEGLRIDHLFVTEPLAARCTEAFIDREERKGEAPSDHAPVGATFG
jgi:exodeoxyribonuclease-3